MHAAKAEPGREGRGWCEHRQLEEELDPQARSVHQVVGVCHLVDGEDKAAAGALSLAGAPSLSCQQHLTLPAVARATAGRFVRCEWLLGRGVCVF